MNKGSRHAQILKRIRGRKLHTQEELAAELARYGIRATQVTLSRDIRELGLVKTPEGYRQIAPATGGPRLSTLATEFLREVRTAQNLVVLKTSPANAGTLAAAVDREDWPEVVGTIAGDDTILVIAPDTETAAKVRGKLLKFL